MVPLETSRWLKQEHELQFPPAKQPPVHMPIAYGLVDISKSKQESLSQPGAAQSGGGGGDSESGEVDQRRSCHFCSDKDKNVKSNRSLIDPKNFSLILPA